jgi:hypothetical protein
MTRLLGALSLLLSVVLLAGCASESMVTTTDLNSAEQTGTYEVHGAVIHPGSFHLTRGQFLTIGEAIQRSGGFKPGNSWDDGGNPDAVRLSRIVHGSVVEYTLYAAPGGRDEGFAIKAGDSIFVPKRPFSSPIPNPLPFAS